MNPDPLSPPVTNFSNKISPSILLIIVILAVIFFLSALLHLLVRYLLRPSSAPSSAAATAVQGQLRHLFHLHDAGVDQSSIDALPVFLYQSLAGRRSKHPFDCAVCLSEFQPADELRLLPGCSHAFHLPCIDTWLLAHSTCPLCRRSLIPDILDSGGEIGLGVGDSGRNQNLGFVEGDGNFIPNSILDDPKEESEAVDSELVRVKLGTFKNLDATEIGGEVVGTSLNINSNINLDQRRCFSMGYYEFVMDEASTKNPPSSKKNTKEKCEAVDSIVVQVKLGSFRNLDATEIGEGTSDSNINFDQRRCFSMGSYEYVMDDASILRVAIEPLSSKKKKLTMSECDCHSKREGFKSSDPPPLPPPSPPTTSSFGVKLQQRESFSFSKIWLRTSKENPKSGDSSRRAASFRLQSELDIDLEVGSHNGSIGSSVEEAPSLVRSTLMWIVGRQNKVGNHG